MLIITKLFNGRPRHNMFSHQGAPLVILLSLFFLQACKPGIYSFSVTPRTIGSKDSIEVKWKVRGDATLIIHDITMPGPDSNALIREFKLVVIKNGKQVGRNIQVAVLPKGVGDKIVFRTTLHGDTLIAAGTNNAQRWGNNFVIGSVINTLDRPIVVSHAGHIVDLGNKSSLTDTFNGTPVAGYWEFRSLLKPAEKNNHSLAPDRLYIEITVKHQ